MTIFLYVALLLFLGWPSPATAQQKGGSCAACHRGLTDERLARPSKQFGEDIHAAKGFGCIACHGGDENDLTMASMSPAKGYVGKPKLLQIVQICGRCHSDARFMRRYNPSLRVDQVTEYLTSIHGTRLKNNSDPKVATCVSCHSAHSIRPQSDPRSTVHPVNVVETCAACHGDPKLMAPYKIPTDQAEKYKNSIHWKMISEKGDLSAPTCNDCHGNHGAAPPGISWIGNVCGQCHVLNTELFDKSKHSKVFIQMGTPGCTTCHDNHEIRETSDQMIGLEEGAVCATCHSSNDNGGKSAAGMRSLIDLLRTEYEKAHATLERAEHAGMEVSQAQFELSGAKTQLIKARAAVHAFAVDAVKQETEPGLEISAKAYTRGLRVLDELRFRRKGLVVSVAIILVLVVGLVFKIRDMERPK